MTPEQKQIAVAEACGWSFVNRLDKHPHGLPPEGRRDRYTSPLPDYLNDLNALAAARDRLINSLELRIRWVNTLREVVGLTSPHRNKAGAPIVSDVDLLFATPGQLFEALGLTLKLWPPPPKK